VGLLKDVPELRSLPMRDVIFERLRKAIVQGELPAGSYFTDVELAEEFGVSRMPVREAVQKLESSGYIERVPMKGNRVSVVTPFEVAHTYAIRKALETLAVQYSALRITDEELAKLRSILDRCDALFSTLSGQDLIEQYLPLIHQYNELAIQACRSERLIELIWAQRELIDRSGVMSLILPFHMDKSLIHRKELYEAFKSRDPEKARTVWDENLGESFAIWREKSGNAKELADFRLI